ncbi:hypothetical protein V1517DRAFT_331609 [Lipomyces orientalis]|uniref:Uncharacterized protein n=1 Tax=Lipomyces orientalis TaxID=1233043 RepID=A0ACC3THU9_9ASCO
MAGLSRSTTALAAASLLILPSLALSAVVTMFVASIVLAFHVMNMYILWFLRVSGIRSPQEKIHELRNGLEISVARLIGGRHDTAIFDEGMSSQTGGGKVLRVDDDVPPPSYIESEWIEQQGRIRRSKKKCQEHGLPVGSSN